MNYFEFHIGDYAEATAHLSFIEDAAYSRMIRKYYAQEKPLPADKKAVQRLVGARTKEEREAVDTMLAEFFQLEDDGWHNGRCDAEIARYMGKSDGKEAKRAAEKERQRRHRERRRDLFEALRERGEVPPFDTPTDELVTMLSQVRSRDVTQPVTRDATATQTPVTNNQTPNPKPQGDDDSTDSGSASSLPDPEPDLPPAADDFDQPRSAPLPMRETPPLSENPAIVLSVALRRLGVNALFTNPHVIEWTAKGVTLELLTEAVDIARKSKGAATIPPGYLVPIVHDLLNPPAAAANGKPKSDDWTWKKSDQGIERKARELGLRARSSESYRDLADRCDAEILKRKGTP